MASTTMTVCKCVFVARRPRRPPQGAASQPRQDWICLGGNESSTSQWTKIQKQTRIFFQFRQLKKHARLFYVFCPLCTSALWCCKHSRIEAAWFKCETSFQLLLILTKTWYTWALVSCFYKDFGLYKIRAVKKPSVQKPVVKCCPFKIILC